MRKTLILLAAAAFLLMPLACQPEPVPGGDDDPVVDPVDPVDTTGHGDPVAPVVVENDYIKDSVELAAIWKDTYADGVVFKSVADVDSARVFCDGKFLREPSGYRITANNDVKYEYYKGDTLRFVHRGAGYRLTIPGVRSLDYTLAKYGMVVETKGARMRMTLEKVNPYSADERGYTIYTTEWLNRYLVNRSYVNINSLNKYSDDIIEDETIIPGYAVSIYSIMIKNAGDYPYPYYKIATVRQSGQWASFFFIVYKSARNHEKEFLEILKSYSVMTPNGKNKNYFPVQEARFNPLWNEETRAYYQKLLDQKTLDFGVFFLSLPGDNMGEQSLANARKTLDETMAFFQGPNGFDQVMGILPTYTHFGYYDQKHEFPQTLAREYAGGNGFNNKPVLQYTFQFTTNNNFVSVANTSECSTPMFNILRGKYDDYFHEMARHLKAYGKPVFLRLNNEMNTDWTSYCGLMTLCDPEIFIATWRRMYDIFNEEKVDNCIFVFNPVAASCPFSFWGEDLSYYPGNDYCQMLGLTNYEDGNSPYLQSFHDRYTVLYNKSGRDFGSMPWIIGEFGCGSGGETTGQLHWNKAAQAQWVHDMFVDFADRPGNPYLQNIKAAIWFSANDYSGSQITNSYRLAPELTDTFAAFREGFDLLEKQ